MFNNIKRERLLKDMSQEKLSKRVGVSRVTISNIERGIYNPSGPLLISISKALGKPVEQIFFNECVKQVLQNTD